VECGDIAMAAHTCPRRYDQVSRTAIQPTANIALLQKLQTPDAELESRRYSEIFTKPKKIEADNYSYQIPPAVELLPSHPRPGPLPRIATRKTSRHWFLDAQTLGFQPEPGRGEVFSELPIAPLNRP
jgi:hypothetical protein